MAGLAGREIEEGGLSARGLNDVSASELEREFEQHREAVLAMLRTAFPRLADLEELYQEAWTELLVLERRGEVVRNRRGLLKTIARRRAADAVKRRRPEAIDPASPVLAEVADGDPLPDEHAQLRLDGDALRLVVESLDEREAAALKLRFDRHLPAREIQEVLGVSEKRLEAIVTKAYKKIEAQLAVDASGQTQWRRRQHSLLLACELGIASAGQQRRAQAMVSRDPACRAMLHAIRTNLGDVAAVLPMPVLVQERERVGGLARASGRLDEWWSAARHLADRVVGRGAPDSRLLEQVGSGGATVGTGAVAAKVVAVCLAVGGTGAICVDVAHHMRERPASAAPPPRQVKQAVVEPARDHVVIVRLPKKSATKSKTNTIKSNQAARHTTPVSSPKSTAPASPAPKGSTEFGPGSLGSTSAPRQPASAPKDGGGEFLP